MATPRISASSVDVTQDVALNTLSGYAAAPVIPQPTVAGASTYNAGIVNFNQSAQFVQLANRSLAEIIAANGQTQVYQSANNVYVEAITVSPVQQFVTNTVDNPGGANLAVQYNLAGNLAGSSSFTFNPATGVLVVPSVTGALTTTVANLHITGGNVGDFLQTQDGNGTLAWAAGAGGNGAPGGVNTFVQFNSGGLFDGANSFTFDKANKTLALGNGGLVGSNLIPNANVTFSLGNVTNHWKDLYLANNSLYLGRTKLSTDGSNLVNTADLFVNDVRVVQLAVTNNSDTSTIIVGGNAPAGNVQPIVQLGGNTTTVVQIGTNANSNITSSGGNIVLPNVSIIAGGTANFTGSNVVGGNFSNVTLNNVTIANSNVSSINNGNSNVVVAANSNVTVSVAGNANVLTVTGTGANITGTANITGNANVGNLGATTAVITTANITTVNTGLVQRGNSNIGIVANANVTINASGASGTWTFDTTGNLTLPTNTANINYANGAPYITIPTTIVNGNSNVTVAANANVTVNAGANARWTFDTVGSLNLTANGVIRNQRDSNSVNIVSNNFVQLQWTTANGVAEPDPNSTAEPTNWMYVDSSGIHLETNVNNGNSIARSWSFDTAGSLNLPQNTDVGAAVIQPNDTDFGIKLIVNGNVWTLGTDASLTFPDSTLQNTAWTGSLANLTNGNSNVKVAANSNVTIGVAGNANILTVTGSTVLAPSITGNTFTLGNASATASTTRWIDATTTSTSPNQVLYQANATGITSIDFHVTATDSTNSRQVSKILAVSLGTQTNYVEYGGMWVGPQVVDITADQSGGNIRLLSSPLTANTIQYNIVLTTYN